MISGNPGSNKSWLALEICKQINDSLFAPVKKLNKDNIILKEDSDETASKKIKAMQDELEQPDSRLFERFEIYQPIKILYIDEETSVQEIKRRWEKITPKNCDLVSFISMAGFRIDNEVHKKTIINLCKECGYQMIVIDSLRDVFSGNENDSTEMQKVISSLKEFTKLGITLLCIHHNRKESPLMATTAAQALRGSTAILAGIDSLISVEKVKVLEDGSTEIFIAQAKLRQGLAAKPFKLLMVEDTNLHTIKFNYIQEIVREETKQANAEDDILKVIGDSIELSRKEIMTILKGYSHSEKTVTRGLQDLELNGQLSIRMEGKRKLYRLRNGEIRDGNFGF